MYVGLVALKQSPRAEVSQLISHLGNLGPVLPADSGPRGAATLDVSCDLGPANAYQADPLPNLRGLPHVVCGLSVTKKVLNLVQQKHTTCVRIGPSGQPRDRGAPAGRDRRPYHCGRVVNSNTQLQLDRERPRHSSIPSLCTCPHYTSSPYATPTGA